MIKNCLSFCLFSLLLLSACQAPPDNSLTAPDQAYFENFLPNIAKAWNAGDREPYIQGHEHSVYMVPHAQTLSNPTEIRAFVEGFPECTTEYSDLEIMGNQELVAVQGKFLVNQLDGSLLDKGKFVGLFTKSDGGEWQLSHAIWNSDLPLPAAAESAE